MSHDLEAQNQRLQEMIADMARGGDANRRELKAIREERNALFVALRNLVQVCVIRSEATGIWLANAIRLLNEAPECSICRGRHPHGAPEHACE